MPCLMAPRVTCRAPWGIAVRPTDGQTVTALLKAVDAAMYGVKRADGSRVGRLRTRPAEPPETPPMSVLG